MWQYNDNDTSIWDDLGCNPAWCTNIQYRRKPSKPKTIKIGEFDVPAPETERPVEGTVYYYPSLTTEAGYVSTRWDNVGFDQRNLKMEKYDVEVSEDGTVRYFKKGITQLHRLDGPAIEYIDGSNVWYQNGELHRLNSPAIEYASGTKYWYQNDKLHRLDGPAVECADGVNEWYIDGVKFTEAQFKRKIASMNCKEMTLAEIEKLLGHKVKIVK